MGCLDGAALAELPRELSGPRARSLDDHLDDCASCLALVAAWARVSTDDDDIEPTRLAATVPSPGPALDDGGKGALDLQPGNLVGDRYVLERVVGEGGMGVVWAARDLGGGGTVAVKLLKGASPELCRRFERETRIASSLVHPNVVEVRAVLSLPDGTPALVMDLLRGRSLAAELAERGGPMGTEEARDVLLPLVDAVSAAHRHGIVHRDIKPGNVFLAEDDDGARVVTLLDFGLAKLIAKDDEAATKLTRTGTMLGTPRYMAPEQLLGEPAVAASDIWALGVVAFECLTGERPLEGKTLAQLVREVTRGNVKRLRTASPLGAVVDAMLAVDPADRPAASEVHARLAAPRRTDSQA